MNICRTHALTRIYKFGSSPLSTFFPDGRAFWAWSVDQREGGERNRDEKMQEDVLLLSLIPRKVGGSLQRHVQ